MGNKTMRQTKNALRVGRDGWFHINDAGIQLKHVTAYGIIDTSKDAYPQAMPYVELELITGATTKIDDDIALRFLKAIEAPILTIERYDVLIQGYKQTLQNEIEERKAKGSLKLC